MSKTRAEELKVRSQEINGRIKVDCTEAVPLDTDSYYHGRHAGISQLDPDKRHVVHVDCSILRWVVDSWLEQ